VVRATIADRTVIQPNAVLLTRRIGKTQAEVSPRVVLHGRDIDTEAKFLATHGGNAPKELGYSLDVTSAGNNAYLWPGNRTCSRRWRRFARRIWAQADSHVSSGSKPLIGAEFSAAASRWGGAALGTSAYTPRTVSA